MRCICIIIVALKSNRYYIFLVYVCSHRYPASTAHMLYHHLGSVWLYHIFPHYLTNGKIFGKKVTEHQMCVLIFSTTFFSETFHILTRMKRMKWDIIIHVHKSVKYPLFLSDFNEIFIFLADFQKNIQIQISWISVQLEPRWSVQTDR